MQMVININRIDWTRDGSTESIQQLAAISSETRAMNNVINTASIKVAG